MEDQENYYSYSVDQGYRVTRAELLKRENEVKEAGLDLEKIIDNIDRIMPGNIKEKVEYITQELGIDKKVFEKFPALFGYRRDNLEPKVEYITQELGIDKKVFEKFPSLFSFTRDNLEPKVEYITQELGIDKKVFEKYPNLFGYRRDNLEPKVEYITQELGIDKKVFEKFPALFGYSMSKRIWPRLELIREQGFGFSSNMLSLAEDGFLHHYNFEKYQLDSKIDQFENSVYAKKL